MWHRPHLFYHFPGILNDTVLSYAFFSLEDSSSPRNRAFYSLSLSWISCSSGNHPTDDVTRKQVWAAKTASHCGHLQVRPALPHCVLVSCGVSKPESPPWSAGPPTWITYLHSFRCLRLSMKQTNQTVLGVLASHKPATPLSIHLWTFWKIMLDWLLLK